MNNKVKIAVDAMSGENSPKKIIDGIEFYLKKNKDNFFNVHFNLSFYFTPPNTYMLIKASKSTAESVSVIISPALSISSVLPGES